MIFHHFGPISSCQNSMPCISCSSKLRQHWQTRGPPKSMIDSLLIYVATKNLVHAKRLGVGGHTWSHFTWTRHRSILPGESAEIPSTSAYFSPDGSSVIWRLSFRRPLSIDGTVNLSSCVLAGSLWWHCCGTGQLPGVFFFWHFHLCVVYSGSYISWMRSHRWC